VTQEARETSDMTSRLLLAYAERQGGREAVMRVLERAGCADREAELRDESTWLSFATKVALFEAAAEVLDDPVVTRAAGAQALDLSVADKGLLSGIPALFGMGRARVSHPSCAAAGDDRCVYELRRHPGAGSQRSGLGMSALATGAPVASELAARDPLTGLLDHRELLPDGSGRPAGRG
jgi:hypothetical protein